MCRILTGSREKRETNDGFTRMCWTLPGVVCVFTSFGKQATYMGGCLSEAYGKVLPFKTGALRASSVCLFLMPALWRARPYSPVLSKTDI